MIKSFRHRGPEKFFKTGSKAGIQPAHATKLELQPGFLNTATSPGFMSVPGWELHPPKGEMAGHWSVKVNGNWRLTFKLTGVDAETVDYRDYH